MRTPKDTRKGWTPGPWRVAENEYNIAVYPWTGAVGIEAPEDEGGILAVPSVVAWTTRGGSRECNARLIAAAPELYDAVIAANFLIEEITDLEGREGMTDAEFAEQVIALAHARRDEICAVLAKAHGET